MGRRHCLKIIPTIFLIVNILIVNSSTPIKICPEGYTLYTNELCYPNEKSLHANDKVVETHTTAPTKICPNGYTLYMNGLCYPNERKPCPFDKADETRETTPVPNSSTMNTPIELKKMSCPHGSIMIENVCRKVICSMGEYYRGLCLQPVCPPGLVWRGKKCQNPGYVTTILEIDNVFINQMSENSIALKTSNENEIVYHTSTSTTTTQNPFSTRASLLTTTTQKPPTTITKYSHINSQNITIVECCEVVSPRICKLYGVKWLCFNRKHHRCDSRVCTSPTVYLKAPEIKFDHPVLVMPPNPQLAACETNDCHPNLNAVDCSGCVNIRSENCSPHCYRYMCPDKTCTFMDLSEYCIYYTGQSGCLPIDGCLWNWC